MTREAFGWAICRPERWTLGGDPILFTVSRTRAEAIEKCMALWGAPWTWRRLYRAGWRARHVRITPMIFGDQP